MRIRDWSSDVCSSDLAPSARHALLRERFGAVGAGVDVRPPFHCDYGFNIRLGDGVFLNFNCVILDVCEVTIGDRTQIAPGVQILTADHPRDPAARATGLEFGRRSEEHTSELQSLMRISYAASCLK